MSAFKGLLKKEFLNTRIWFIAWLILIVIAMGAAFIISERMQEPMVMVGFLIAITVFHFGFLPIMVLSSLNLEGKTQLWLYNPQSSKMLLFSKLALPFIYQFISQVFVVILTMIVYTYVAANGTHIDHLPVTNLIYIHIFLLLTGIYLSCWILLYWCFYHSLGKYPSIKKIRWLFMILLFFFLIQLKHFL